MCVLEKNVYSDAIMWNVLYISDRFIWSTVLFKSSISLLIFYLVVLSIIEIEVLKSIIIIVLLSFSPLSFLMFASYIWVLWCWVYMYL